MLNLFLCRNSKFERVVHPNFWNVVNCYIDQEIQEIPGLSILSAGGILTGIHYFSHLHFSGLWLMYEEGMQQQQNKKIMKEFVNVLHPPPQKKNELVIME